jgi:uncharacterized protein
MAEGIWLAARSGDLGEVEWLVDQDPGLLNAKADPYYFERTPLMFASREGHTEVVRWLLDEGAALDTRDTKGITALWFACSMGHTPVVRLLLERGGDPTIAPDIYGWTPLITASQDGHLEVVRLLLGHPSVNAAINQRDRDGETALYSACYWGHGGSARVLLESGADPTIANRRGTTPMAIAKRASLPEGVTVKGRRECVAALEVSLFPLLPLCKHLII